MTPEAARLWFGYIDGTPEQVEACIRVRTGFAQAAACVAENVPDGPDQTYTLRKLKDACQAAIGGIVAPFPPR